MSETNARRAAVLRVYAKSRRLHDRLLLEVIADDVAINAPVSPRELLPWVEGIARSMPGSALVDVWLGELQKRIAEPEPPPLTEDPGRRRPSPADPPDVIAAAGHTRASRASDRRAHPAGKESIRDK